ncbi:MAG: HAD family hydrolase [Nitrospinota bacterium]|nr:HAD family hydrolase [Nitrospinota bacterium]
MQIKSVSFDLFDTLIDFDFSLLPIAEVNGERERTTSKVAYERLYNEGFALPTFLAFHVVWQEISKIVWNERDKDAENREISSIDRFRRLSGRFLNLTDKEREKVANIAMEAHMETLLSATVFDNKRLSLLEKIKNSGLLLGLLSNFDHSKGAKHILEKTGILPFLDVSIISEDEGYRKPRSSVFVSLSEKLNLNPSEILFVGDTFEADIIGAKSVGMKSVWLNKDKKVLSDQSERPDFEIQDVMQVIDLINI